MDKPVIGFTTGDLNGIGLEIIIKALSDNRILDICTPVIFGNNKVVNFYRKTIAECNLNYAIIKDADRVNPKQVNLFTCWDDEVAITPGQLTDPGGQYAIKSLVSAMQALKEGRIHGVVTAPIHKKNVQSEIFSYSGHTPYLKDLFGVKDVVMLMVAENMRVGLLTEHVPVQEVAEFVTVENILSKLEIMDHSLRRDFGIQRPRIGVLGLNPHAGDEGLVGREEQDVIIPALKAAREKKMLCFGPYSADAFFAQGSYKKFDAVLAMYHDQGLIPFKSLAIGEGVNFTAGINAVRTSPDHGTAFDIAGKGIANEASLREAIFTCIDIIKSRNNITDMYSNPIRRVSASVLRNAVDEKISEEEG